MNAPLAGDDRWPALRSGALDWLVRETAAQPYADDLFAELCERLCADGLPLDRATLHVRTLHPQFVGARFLWRPGIGKPEFGQLTHQEAASDPRFRHNPIRALYEGAEGIRRRFGLAEPEAGEEEYGVYQDLRAEGITDYVALPMVFTDGKRHACTWATKRPGGFTTEHLVRISDLLPVLAMATEIRLNRRIAKNLLNTYVGSRAGERVLAGDILRGSGATVRAAIWNCDLRSFTAISEHWPQAGVIEALNDYFDAMGAPVERHGGEILKFIGDGMLAVFPLDAEDACVRALRAAVEARRAMAELNERRTARGAESLGYGLALHVGDVMYGNIGTTSRLDFTVIGPAVNATSRLEGLTKVVGRKVLLSSTFAYMCGCSPEFLEPLGSYPLRGLGEPLDVFALVEGW
jgi:adenylate cyclase